MTDYPVDDLIRRRKSTRAYNGRPVPRDTISEILDVARWAPSGGNGQPWRVTVADGSVAADLRTRLVEASRTHAMTPEQVEANQRRLAEGPMGWLLDHVHEPLYEAIVMGSMGFFGAPVALVVSYAGHAGSATPDGVAAFVTLLALAAEARGLGSVWLGWPMRHNAIIREVLDIPPGEQLGAFVALGYADPDAAINRGRSPRRGVDEFVRWAG